MTNPLPSFGIGIDIGGTSTKAAVIDGSGAIVASTTMPTLHGADGVVDTAVRAARHVAGAAGLAVGEVDAVGVGIPGTVDHHLGTVRFAVNVGLGSATIELGTRLATELGRRVHVENDVRAAAFGADWYLRAEGRPAADLAYLSVGTGIAAGFVDNGRLRRGTRFVAGEIGHIPVDPAGPVCACGQVGCVEAIASGSAIERMWPTTDGVAAVELLRAVVSGSRAAALVWAQVIEGLSSAVLMLALTHDPEVIVVSGGVAALGSPLRDALAHRLAEGARRSEFLASLDVGGRVRVIDPSVALGPIGAVRAAYSARSVDAVASP